MRNIIESAVYAEGRLCRYEYTSPDYKVPVPPVQILLDELGGWKVVATCLNFNSNTVKKDGGLAFLFGELWHLVDCRIASLRQKSAALAPFLEEEPGD